MPTMTQAELLRKAAGPIATGDFSATSGLLSPEQSTAFLDAAYDATPLAKLIRTERRRAKSGSIAKIGIGGRLLRKKTAGVDDATLAKPTTSDVSFQTVGSRLDWEIEEEVFQENIEQEGYEDHLGGLMADQVGRDLEDLHINGDTADTSSDAPFLTQNDGWLKLIAAGGSGAHRVNGATIGSGYIQKGHFFAALAALPSKYHQDGGLRFLGNPTLWYAYLEYLSNRATGVGDAALSGTAAAPQGVPFVQVPAMPSTRLLLVNPKNLIAVNTREIRKRKTTEGREAIRQDKRFYAIFLDDDPIVEEMDAVADVYGVIASVAP